MFLRGNLFHLRSQKLKETSVFRKGLDKVENNSESSAFEDISVSPGGFHK